MSDRTKEKDFDLFYELSKLPRPNVTVEFPLNKKEREEVERGDRPKPEVALVTLNNYEMAQAKKLAVKSANEQMGKDGNSSAWKDLYSDAFTSEILYASCRNPFDLAIRFFPSRESVNMFTNDQLGALANHYNALIAFAGPVISGLSIEEMNDWIKRIAEAGETGLFFMNTLTPEEAKALLVHSASIANLHLQTVKNSAGEPQESLS